MKSLPNNLPEEWDLRPLFANDHDPAIQVEKARAVSETKKFVEKWESRTDYLTNPQVLKEALDDYNHWLTVSGAADRINFYFWLRSEVVENPTVKAGLNQSEDLARQLANEIQFFTLRLGKVSESKQQEFLAHTSLEPYQHFLERLFVEARYTLSEPEEKLIKLFSGPAFGNWVRLVSSLLSQEVVNGKNFSELVSLVDSADKATRDEAAEQLNQIFTKHLAVAEAELNSVLATKKTSDDLRGFSRPDLSRHLGDDIESEIVDTLVSRVAADFTTAQRYYALKAKLLGVTKLAYHERNVPIGNLDQKYSYSTAVSLVYRALSNLDPQFGEIFYNFVVTGQIDVGSKPGKSSGAFCASESIGTPTYILLNHHNRARDVLTLAHEVGHGINNELIRQHQRAIYFGTPVSTAEVASTFMEDFTLREIAADLKKEDKLALMMLKLGDDISTIYRQVAFYLFERDLHQAFRVKSFLSHQEIGKLFQKHMEAYMGPAVEQSPGAENWWLYVSHFRSFFYVYSYASGLLISKALQAAVRAKPELIIKVKDFLATGTSASARKIFSKLGLDIAEPAFWKSGLTEVRETLAQAEVLAKELGLS